MKTTTFLEGFERNEAPPKVTMFLFTDHFVKRMRERGVPNPNGLLLKVAKKKLRAKIRKDCPKSGTREDCVYWYFTNVLKQTFVYVSVPSGVNNYIMITCLRYDNPIKL